MSNEKSYLLRWDQHEEHRTSTFKTLWENEDFLDVTIACDDEQIDAHKVILSAASPFFRNLLKRNPHSHPLIYLRGSTRKHIQALMDFIYSGEAQVHRVELEEFMNLAKSLQVKGLVEEDLIEESGSQLESKNVEHVKVGMIEKEAEYGPEIYTTATEYSENKDDTITDLAEKSSMNELSEKMGEIENDIFDTSCGGSNLLEENFSFKIENTPNKSSDEFKQKVSKFVEKIDLEYNCRACQYSSKRKDHVTEHAEKHIEGNNFECKFCDKTFNRSRILRKHQLLNKH